MNDSERPLLIRNAIRDFEEAFRLAPKDPRLSDYLKRVKGKAAALKQQSRSTAPNDNKTDSTDFNLAANKLDKMEQKSADSQSGFDTNLSASNRAEQTQREIDTNLPQVIKENKQEKVNVQETKTASIPRASSYDKITVIGQFSSQNASSKQDAAEVEQPIISTNGQSNLDINKGPAV